MTMHARAANMYRRIDLESAPKSQIVERLFARFAMDIEEARTALAAKDIAGKAKALDHATCIVFELKAALDHASAPELCAHLEALYDFVIQRLTNANMTLAIPPVDQAAKIMAELGAAFREVK